MRRHVVVAALAGLILSLFDTGAAWARRIPISACSRPICVERGPAGPLGKPCIRWEKQYFACTARWHPPR